MANTQQIRRRIKSIRSTRQITKAMEMVAAAKMRKAQESAQRARDYSQLAEKMLALLSSQNFLYRHRLSKVKNPHAPTLLLVIGSDKGLAGSYNALVLRQALETAQDLGEKNVSLLTVGKKAGNFFGKLDLKILASFEDVPTLAQESFIQPVSKVVQESFLAGKFSKVKVVYTQFVSTIKQIPQTATLLPAVLKNQTKFQEPEGREKVVAQELESLEFQFEPSRRECLDVIIPRLTQARLFQMFADALASEHSSRMVAMKNASDNADEIIRDLTLVYNSVRQASITQELLEIVSGDQT